MPEEVVSADVIAITGHRVYPDPANLYRGLDRLNAREYYFGGARGVDTDALNYISRTQPGSVRTVVVPNRVIDQPFISQEAIRLHATRVIELRNTGSDRYMIRNRFMVDKSTHLRAFYDFRGRGGTYNTIEYARSRGTNFDVYPLNGFNKNDVMNMSEKGFRTWTGMIRRYKVPLIYVKGIILEYMRQTGNTALSYWFPEIMPGKMMESVW